MRDRTFGVEIECGVDVSGRSHGEPPDCVCEWDEESQEYWPEGDPDGHCVSCCGCWDGSVAEYGCEFAVDLLHSNGFSNWTHDVHRDGSGVEIPSPILQGTDGLDELQQVMDLLERHGFYTTDRDGMHVHHGAEDFQADEVLVVRLVELWEENLPHIHKLVHEYRTRSGWCKSRKEVNPTRWAEFKREKKLASLDEDYRYYALNVSGLRYRPTIEFRLHQGTLDFEKAAAWIQFGQEFLELAKRKSTVYTCASVNGLLRMTGTSRKVNRTLRVKAAA